MDALAELDRLFEPHPGLLKDFPVRRLVDLIQALPPATAYDQLGGAASSLLASVAQAYGENGAEYICRRTIIHFIETATPTSADTILTPDTIRLTQQEHSRILQNVVQRPIGYYRPNSDSFLKDLGLSRYCLIAAGAQVVDLTQGPGRRPAISGGLLQCYSFVRMYYRRPIGFPPIYEIHTHNEMLSEFTEDGWNRCYLRIAGLLEQNPSVKGFYGSSWFYDPHLSAISPRLCYLRHVPVSNGAYLFYVEPDTSSNAIATSQTRRDLYEQGRYQPKIYLLIWHRDDVIAWAKANKRHLLHTDQAALDRIDTV